MTPRLRRSTAAAYPAGMNAARLTVCLLAACLFSAVGCSTSSSSHAETDATPSMTLPEPRILGLYRGDSGAAVPWHQMIADMAEADVVLIGEQHGHLVGLEAAATIFDDLTPRSPAIALSMEFFERDQQSHIDDYLTGITDEETFKKATKRNPGSYPDGHRRMVETAKDAGRPVIAANAPRRYVRLARTDGFDRLNELTPEQRRLVTLPGSLTTGRYRDQVFELMGGMGGHGGDDDASMTEEERAAKAAEMEAMIETFFRSQNVWDATMAEAIVSALESGSHPVVHVVGQFHSDYDGGLTERVQSRAPRARVITYSVVDTWSDELREEDRDRADYVMYVGERIEAP